MRIFLLVIVAVLILGSAVALAASLTRTPRAAAPSPSPITFQEDSRAARLKISVSFRDENDSELRLLDCQASRCTPGLEEKSAYIYQNDAIVRRNSKSEKNETLVAKTPLVAPRGIFLSPDGAKLAYFLDNIHDKKAELTELWYLNTQTGERHLVAEKITQGDVLTAPRWNSASTHLWLIVNSGQKDQLKVELAVAGVSPPSFSARFAGLDWESILESFDKDVADISFTGRSLALAQSASAYRTNLTIVHEGSEAQTAVVRGQVPFLQWLSDGRLLYAVQDDSAVPAGRQGFSLWTVRSTVHTFAARLPGRLEAGRADPSGKFIAFVAEEGRERTWSAFQVTSGLVFRAGSLPSLGEKADITQAVVVEPAVASISPGASAVLEDAEITAFIEKNLIEISGETTAQPQRIITTNEMNVVYVDFRVNTKEDRRLLLTIRDAIHPEWSIRARYEPAGGEWRKVEGGGVKDPDPQNVYEWEESLQQWILKSSQQGVRL